MAPIPQAFDLQVNGYGGVDFNQDDLSSDAAELACARLAADGVDGALATIITESLDLMVARTSRIARIIEQSGAARRMLRGIHLEGPFISPEPGYRGAHPLDGVRGTDLDALKRLVDAGAGLVKIVTLAPECDDDNCMTKWLSGQGIVIAAGHCNPSLDRLTAAVDAGVTLFTHLGNGCPLQMGRHDNIVQRALSLSDRLWCSFIADGVHVPFFALRNYIRAANIDRCVVVTDAIAAAGLGPGRYKLSRWEMDIHEDLAAWAPDGSHLLGSACTMPRTISNLIDHCGFTAAQAAQLTSDNPRRAIGA